MVAVLVGTSSSSSSSSSTDKNKANKVKTISKATTTATTKVDFIDYGLRGEWEAVKGKCTHKRINEYKYSFCFFIDEAVVLCCYRFNISLF